MTYARKLLVSLQDTPYYHVVARCVRRAWLWGLDEYAGRDYSHRKAWVLGRLAQLSSVFTIDVCAYAVMSDHYHLVLHVDQRRAQNLSEREIVERWTTLFGEPALIERWREGQVSATEKMAATAIIERWRARLHDISWFMKALNEYLARRANSEDECTGHFWEGRFKSQALLDEAGLITAMAYVDLNPIRAGIAATPEESTFTSIYERIRTHRQSNSSAGVMARRMPVHLHPFRTCGSTPKAAIPFYLQDYLQLVDWTGRSLRPDKSGAIDHELPSIMRRLNIDEKAWQLAMRPWGNIFGRAMGRLNRLRIHANTLRQSWIQGQRSAKRLFPT